VRLLAAIAAMVLVAGCGPSGPAFQNTDITGADWAREFSLTDHTGKPRTLNDFRGKVVVVFFGYVHCPDVCPTTLTELKSVVEQLGDEGKRVQVLFITVDPERDTRELLAQYVPVFHPGFLGLYGDQEQTARTAKEFKVFYQKVPGSRPDNYSIDHTAGSYVFDPSGRVRLYVSHGQADTLAADIRTLLKGG
jgi:protein SCO1/2